MLVSMSLDECVCARRGATGIVRGRCGDLGYPVTALLPPVSNREVHRARTLGLLEGGSLAQGPPLAFTAGDRLTRFGVDVSIEPLPPVDLMPSASCGAWITFIFVAIVVVEHKHPPRNKDRRPAGAHAPWPSLHERWDLADQDLFFRWKHNKVAWELGDLGQFVWFAVDFLKDCRFIEADDVVVKPAVGAGDCAEWRA